MRLQVVRDRLEQPPLGHHSECLLGGARAQQLVELLDQPRGRAARDLTASRGDRLIDRRVDPEAQARGHRDGSKHPDRVLLESLRRVADAADDTCTQIVEAARVVDDRERRDVVEQRVDREVAAERILFRRAERVVAMNETVGSVVARRRSAERSSGGGGSSMATSSSAVTGRRNVATSIVFVPKRTWASRNRRPMIQQFLNSFLTW